MQTASGGAALSTFLDFFRTTGPLIYTSAEDVVNELTLNTYLLSRIMGSSEMEDMVQGGESIRDDIYLEEQSRYTHYHPNDEFEYGIDQTISQWSVPWRFSVTSMSFTDQEIGLNSGDLNRGAMFHQFKRLKKAKAQNMWTSLCNGMEADLFADPVSADMEASSGKVPYSLGVHINEFDNGLPPGFSTVQGLNPATLSKWRNATETYADLPKVDTDLFDAFTRMYHKLRFEQMPKRAEYGEPTSVAGFIMASLNGVANYEQSLRLNQDTFVTTGRQDPAYNNPAYRGIPLIYIKFLDHANLYDDGSSGLAGEDASSVDINGNALADPEFDGPRYWWINPRYLRKVIHRDRYLYEEMVQPSRQPFTRVMVVDTWHNNIVRSRQRHGLVSPSADLT